MTDLIIRNINEVYLQIDCEDSVSYELNEFFAFRVIGAEFSPKYRARLWNGMIHLFSIKTRQIYRGLLPQIIKFFEDRSYSYTYEYEEYNNEFSLNEAKQFIKTLNLKIEPRDYQIDAFVHTIRNKRSLLLSPTASGKSLIIYLIIRYLYERQNIRKFLIIVPTVSLVSQLYSDFSDYGFDSNTYVHRIFSGQDKETDKPIVISTWQSLFKLPKKYFESFETVVGDEAHLYKAKSLTDIMTNLINAKYRIGTTGTLDGTKTNKLVLEGLFGSVNKVTTTKKLMDQKHIADFSIKCLVLKHNDNICQAAKNFTYPQEIEYLVLNEDRNKFITNLALSLEGNTLLLYQYVDKHGKILYDMISKRINDNRSLSDDRKVFFISGDVDAEIREETRKIVENEQRSIIVASFGTFSTGTNIRNLHNIIFASPSKSRIRNLQSIGRGLRKSETKSNAVLFDIADDLRYKKHDNYTLKQFALRLKIYSEEQFKFKIFKISLRC